MVISAYTGYDWSKLKYWANSLDRCGFNGDRVMVVYNSNADTVSRLNDLGFKIWAFDRDQQTGDFVWPQDLVIVVQRFYHMWYYLDQLPDDHYRFVISTDCKDVVFQENPSRWLEENIGSNEIVASCESLRYQDEPWGDDNLAGSFPMIHRRLRTNPIWNCGVQAGRMSAMRDLWLQIWLLSKAAGRPNPDQAAYNLLLGSRAWAGITRFTMSEDGWACQAGTTVDPAKIGQFRSKLLEPEPIWTNGRSATSTGTPHVILHQWDRVPDWTAEISRIYG